MKLRNYLPLFFCLLLCGTASAEEHERTMAISISPASLIIGSVDVLYQAKLTDYMALTIPAAFGYNWPLSTYLGFFEKSKTNKITMLNAPISVEGGLGLRFTPFSRVFHDSFYVEPRLTIKYSQFGAELDAKTLEWKKLTLTPAVNFGYDWYWSSGFLISAGAGVGYALGLDSKHTIPPEVLDAFKTASRVWPTKLPGLEGYWVWDLEFKIGFAW